MPQLRINSRDLLRDIPALEGVDLERLTGVRERRVCGDGEDSLSLSVGAARDCLAHSEREAGDLDAVLCTSITRSEGPRELRFEPSFAATVARHIDAAQAITFDVSNACAGMCTGVAILHAMIGAGTIRRGMVISGEHITPLAENARRSMVGIEDPQLASLTLGDSGAAVIVERADRDEGRILASEFTTLAEYSHLCIGKPSPAGPGGAMYTDTQRIHRVSIANAPKVIRKTLESAKIDYSDLEFLIPHQTSSRAIRAGRRFVDAYFETTSGGPRYLENIADYGNTSSTTHFLALYRFLEEGLFRERDRVLLVAQASGLVVGGLIFQIGRLGKRYGRRPSSN